MPVSVTLRGFECVYGSHLDQIGGSLDALSVSLDSPVWGIGTATGQGKATVAPSGIGAATALGAITPSGRGQALPGGHLAVGGFGIISPSGRARWAMSLPVGAATLGAAIGNARASASPTGLSAQWRDPKTWQAPGEQPNTWTATNTTNSGWGVNTDSNNVWVVECV